MQRGVQGVVQEVARVSKRSDNSLYCTNRTSLENLFYATRASIYTKSHGSYWKLMECYGNSRKGIEGDGRL